MERRGLLEVGWAAIGAAGDGFSGLAARWQGGTAIRLTVLGSGSAGNATLVANGDARVLIDAGLSYREVARRLALVGTEPAAIDAIMITHAHGDHTRGARLLARRHAVPVYSTAAVRDEWGVSGLPTWRELAPPRPLDVCGLRFVPFTIPHDASQTVAFRIEAPAGAVGFATDIGAVTPELIERFADCRVLVIESNHADELLRMSPYDAATRARIASDTGHLSNESVAEFIRRHLGPSVRCIVLMHLSRVNNVPEIAELTCRDALAACGRTDVRVVVTRQDRVAPTVALDAWTPPGQHDAVPAGRPADEARDVSMFEVCERGTTQPGRGTTGTEAVVPQGAHGAPRRTRRGAEGAPLATAGGLGRSPI